MRRWIDLSRGGIDINFKKYLPKILTDPKTPAGCCKIQTRPRDDNGLFFIDAIRALFVYINQIFIKYSIYKGLK